MSMITYPLNDVEYTAEDAELFHMTRTSGVYANNSFDCSLSGADNTVVIGTGIAWIKNSEFSGKVVAQKEAVSLNMGLPDANYPRIDAIIIKFDANSNSTDIVVKNGTASSNPIAPIVTRTESIYELHLYHVNRNAGSLYITPSDITDLRLNSVYCGLMADSITKIDTDSIEKQISDLIEKLQNEISNVENGSAYLLRDGANSMTGNLSMGDNKITGLGTPTANMDAVTKEYADTKAGKLKWLYTYGSLGLGHAERSITLETMHDYSWLMIVWKAHKSSQQYYRSFIPVYKNDSMPSNQNLRIETIMDGGYYRNVSITDTGISVTTATKADGSGTNTAYCILCQVWGFQ